MAVCIGSCFPDPVLPMHSPVTVRCLTVAAGPSALGFGTGALQAMTSKYYAHFLAESPEPRQAGEFTGVVEVERPLRHQREIGDLKTALALNFDLDREDIRILDWSRLH